MPNKELKFSMQNQLQTNWCWAANATSISQYYNRNTPWTQCRLACNCLNRPDCCSNPAPNLCNRPYYLHTALQRTGNLRNFFAGTLTPDMIRSEIDNGWVIGVRIGWRSDGGHFVTIHGYDDRSGELFVYISDPRYGKCYLKVNDFATRYLNEGIWTHTFLIKALSSMIEYTHINNNLLQKAKATVPETLLNRMENLITENAQSNLESTMPHDSYIIDYSALKEKKEVTFIHDGVRLLDQNEEGHNLIFEFAKSGWNKMNFKQVIYEDYVDNYKEILDKIKEDMALNEDVYTISLVRQPQLKVDAICLSGPEEKYIPLMDNDFLKRGESYPAAVFSELLIQHAKEKHETGDDLLGG